MPISPGPRPAEPTAEGREFRRLSDGLRTKTLVELLHVSREMISRYRYYGAPREKLAALQDYLDKRAQGVDHLSASSQLT
jgi:predicted transcriptional regulator